jgi:hypothetical protein
MQDKEISTHKIKTGVTERLVDPRLLGVRHVDLANGAGRQPTVPTGLNGARKRKESEICATSRYCVPV